MNEADWDTLNTYVRAMADAIGLRDWEFVLKRQPPLDEEVLASVSAIYGRRMAFVRVCAEFRELTREEARQTIIHELVHCHHATLGHMLAATLKDQLGRTGELVMVGIRAEFEHLVDAIATQWAPALPYIEWTTPDPAIDKMVNVPYEGPIDAG